MICYLSTALPYITEMMLVFRFLVFSLANRANNWKSFNQHFWTEFPVAATVDEMKNCISFNVTSLVMQQTSDALDFDPIGFP